MLVEQGQIIQFYNNHLPELYWLVIEIIDEIRYEDEEKPFNTIYCYRINYDAKTNWIIYEDYQIKDTDKMVIAEDVPTRVIDFCTEIINQKRKFWNNFQLK